MNRFEAKLRLERVQKEFSKDFHNIFTPFELCDEMLNKIPELNKDMKILVMFNLEFLFVLQERWEKEGMKNVWFMTPCEIKKKVAIQMGVNENNVIRYEYNTKQIDRKDMPKFDVVVGNPPYLKNTHLKMLSLVVDTLNENGKVIWLHPSRWLQDATAPYKKNSDFNKYKNLPFVKFEIISNLEANKLFKILIQSDLLISYLENNKESILSEDSIYSLRNIPLSLKRILTANYTSIESIVEYNKLDGIRAKITNLSLSTFSGDRIFEKGRYDIIHKNHAVPFINGKYNEKDWTTMVAKNQFTKSEGTAFPLSIKFNTLEEAQNFINSTYTDVFQFFNFLSKVDVNINLRYLPFMNDYNKPWTNERFQEYFNISEEEMIFIKETMKKYL